TVPRGTGNRTPAVRAVTAPRGYRRFFTPCLLGVSKMQEANPYTRGCSRINRCRG
ncbi:Os01g0159500, partial [Oryza sativa Japonica Group]